MSSTALKTERDADRLLRIYTDMLRIRLFEEAANGLYLGAKMPGLAHLYSGEEGVAVGVCAALRDDDYITSTHRGHGHCLAKGAAADLMLAELLGKAVGYCGGKGGSMHIADQARGNLGANAIVGGSAGIATGAAMSAKWRGTDQVAACFFGEGALGQGLVYEVMNMASLWRLPVVYVCENNLYNEYTSASETTAGSIAQRAQAFDIPVREVDGQDVLAVWDATQEAVDRARSGGGPSFLHCRTYRQYGHHVGDVNRTTYRSREEEQEWAQRDPIAILGQAMSDLELADAAALERIREEVQTEISQGVEFALAAPYPDPDEVYSEVYA
ncbi:MAG TPA: thiamine pyrophosphate-dependent dehydrogenase E1 component subunit alpha [Candidatus Nitrosotalea sp.]|nr:thiamine pyrophosphate-dependent dehydrogenase E1 component subunit alpha [Candidatus Nitrosotalea sp.]